MHCLQLPHPRNEALTTQGEVVPCHSCVFQSAQWLGRQATGPFATKAPTVLAGCFDKTDDGSNVAGFCAHHETLSSERRVVTVIERMHEFPRASAYMHAEGHPRAFKDSAKLGGHPRSAVLNRTRRAL